MRPMIVRVVVVLLFAAAPLSAEVVRVEVQARSQVAGGQTFGAAGSYEKISGKIFFAVDPALAANRIVADIDKAPRSAAGKVEFSADFFLLKPTRIDRGNGAVLYEVSNRGGKGMLGFFDHASGSLDPTTAADLGDGFLLRQGFTLLWVGWQFDPPQRAGLVRVYPPTATDNGRPIRGLVRSDFVVTEREADHSLADRDHLAYAVVDPESPDSVMTVRDSVDGERRVVPRGRWGFGRAEGGRNVADTTRVYIDAKFEPGKIYEVVYTAQNPPLVGLGPAAIRDVVSMLKYGSADALSIPASAITRALAFGVSQSGRFLRTYLYYGFNRDERNRKVFDGVIAQVAGAGRGSFNHRFAQPSRDGHPYLNFFYPTDIFPFTDLPQRDPQTGVTDGLLTHAGSPDLLPKVFYTNSEYEYWGRAASLIHTTIDGAADAPLMDNVRIYLLTAGQHGPAAFPPAQTIGQQRTEPLSAHQRRHARSAREAALPEDRRRDDDHRGAQGVSRGLRAEVRDGRDRHRGAAADHRGVSDSRPAGGRRRQRHRGHPHARARRAAGDLHRVEPVQRSIGADDDALEHAGLVHPAAARQRRAEAGERSAPVNRRALPRQGSVSRGGEKGGAGSRRPAPAARRRSGHDRAQRRAALGCRDVDGCAVDRRNQELRMILNS
ncbi:MAG: hypothetical protein DMF93_01650 [Acidobacteria bacterium]|nr:MAG: hypothetical protein DMF93_01650 [Acidobacteriota bacterium]